MKPHILVVDDSLTVRMDLRGALIAAGFDVTLCESKRAAEAQLERVDFNAVVLDVMLPDGDGVDILKFIRSRPGRPDMPVVMLSTEAEVEDRVRGLTMGADEYVGKPYNIAYFIRCLRKLCLQNRSSSSLPVTIVGCRRILAVDDSPTFLTILGRMLREDGHDVVLARSGREALDMLAAQTIDCVVVDLLMPDVDGFETIRKIRETPGRESTPTLMLTASENPHDQRLATAAGADEFVIKAATLDVVRAKIRNLLRRKHREQPNVDAVSVTPRRTVPPSRQEDASQGPPSTRHLRTQAPAATQPCPLFLDVAAALGLDTERARETLARTLRRMNINPDSMSHADVASALPTLRDTLSMFFAPHEIAPRLHALSMLVSRAARLAS